MNPFRGKKTVDAIPSPPLDCSYEFCVTRVLFQMKTILEFAQQMRASPLFIRREGYHRWAPLLLRLVIGFGFMDHGWAKLSRGPEHFEQLLVQIGAPFPHLTSWVSPLVEIFGGLAIFVGVYVTITSLPLIAILLVAMFTVHLKYGFSSINTIGLTPAGPLFGPPGYEVVLLYIAGLISFMLGGAGIFSVDSWINSRK
jgi:putative oxidoreductase